MLLCLLLAGCVRLVGPIGRAATDGSTEGMDSSPADLDRAAPDVEGDGLAADVQTTGPGTPDRTFGAGTGIVVFNDARVSSGLADEVQVDAQGRLVVAGMCTGGNNQDGCVVRLLPDGSNDNTFADAGLFYFDRSAWDWCRDLALDQQQRIVVAGYSDFGSDDPVIWRFDANGQTDSSFVATPGYLRIPYRGETAVTGLVIDGAGNYVITAQARGSGHLAIWRVKPDATLDDSFGTAGRVLEGTFGFPMEPEVVIDGQERIVVVGGQDPGLGTGQDMVAYRFLPSGAPDPDFNQVGTFRHDGAAGGAFGADRGFNLTVDDRDRVLIAGESHNGTDLDAVVWRLTEAGQLDQGFGKGGVVVLPKPAGAGDDSGAALVIDDKGRIVVGGVTDVGAGKRVTIWRLSANGDLDSTFGLGEGFFVDSQRGQLRSIAIDGAGRIVAAGRRGGQLAVYRLN
jgi:uncharacterized delta-60 repeat protein